LSTTDFDDKKKEAAGGEREKGYLAFLSFLFCKVRRRKKAKRVRKEEENGHYSSKEDKCKL